MQGCEAPCTCVLDFEQVAQVGPRIAAARGAIAPFIDRAEVVRVLLVEDVVRVKEVVIWSRPVGRKPGTVAVEAPMPGIAPRFGSSIVSAVSSW